MNAFPVYHVPMTPKDKPWITPFIKHLIQKRWDAYRLKDFARYNVLKLLIRRKIVQAKSNWSNKFSNPSELWKKVNYIGSRKNANVLHNSFINCCCTQNLCNDVNSVFCNNFSVCHKMSLADILSDCSDFKEVAWDLVISDDDVFQQLSLLDSKKAFGSDCIPTFVYKTCANIIAKPLANIYNYCISNCCFPSIWKEAHVVPVPKCHNANIHQLRPISLLCVPSKIFERLVFNSVKHLFYLYFDSSQFGFRQNCSTTCALIKLHNHITECFDNPTVAGIQVFALDYSKAFDRLDHNVIIRKFVNCNFPLSFVSLMYSYLCNRSQRVRLNNCLSDKALVTSGVPQGSILGPSIFSLVMADLTCLHSSSCIVKYADDVSLSIPIYHSNNYVVDEIDISIKYWSSTVGLNLNTSKCKYMLVSHNKKCSPIIIPDFEFCNSIKVLGVYFCNNLKWDLHFSNIFTTANRRAYAFRVLKSNLSATELLTVYKSLILSLIDYCAPLFIGLNQKNCNILNAIQRKFHNIVCFYNCHCNIFPDISARRTSFSVKLFNRAHSDSSHLLHCIIPKKRTFFIQPHSKSEIRKRSFIPFITEIVNNCIERT